MTTPTCYECERRSLRQNPAIWSITRTFVSASVQPPEMICGRHLKIALNMICRQGLGAIVHKIELKEGPRAQ